jgi:hypothetical protein
VPRPWLVSLLFVAVTASLIAALRALPDTIASGDGAIAELYVVHATRGPWLLGPYSQFYWNHPGPLLFYLLLPFYSASGGHALALNVGAAALNVGAVLWTMRSLQQEGEPALTVAAAVALAAWSLRVPSIVDSYWNPVLIALPAVLFAVACAQAAADRKSALIVVVAVGAFLAQSHVGLVPPVAAATAIAFASVYRRRTRWTLAAIPLAALLWAPSAIEELTGAPGNLTMLAWRATSPTRPARRARCSNPPQSGPALLLPSRRLSSRHP